MAIRIRRGNQADLDPNKLVAGELGLVLDAGKLYFCYSAGNTKQLTTAEDVQTLLNASPVAYTALQQCLVDLANNPSELTDILSNISALQTKVGSATLQTSASNLSSAVNELYTGKQSTTNMVQTDAVNDATKYPSTVVTYTHGLEIDAINDNLVTYGLPVANNFSSADYDCDNYKTFCMFYFSIATLHRPSFDYGLIIAFGLGNVISGQIAIAPGGMATRFCTDNVWTDWGIK